MSWYTTVVLSFSTGEFDGEMPPKDFEPLLLVNAWLKQQKFSKLSDLSRGKLGSNALLYGGCYNHLDLDEFMKVVGQQHWQDREDVQMIVWDGDDSQFSVIGLPPQKSVAKKSKTKPQAH